MVIETDKMTTEHTNILKQPRYGCGWQYGRLESHMADKMVNKL